MLYTNIYIYLAKRCIKINIKILVFAPRLIFSWFFFFYFPSCRAKREKVLRTESCDHISRIRPKSNDKKTKMRNTTTCLLFSRLRTDSFFSSRSYAAGPPPGADVFPAFKTLRSTVIISVHNERTPARVRYTVRTGRHCKVGTQLRGPSRLIDYRAAACTACTADRT